MNLAGPTSCEQHRAGWWASVRRASADIKLAHSVFALPFAILGACLATPALGGQPPPGAWRTFAYQLLVVVLCMVFARTWAMLVNRLADRGYDARNQRTAARAIASGRLALDRARLITGAAALGFIACCALFLLFNNAWPIALDRLISKISF